MAEPTEYPQTSANKVNRYKHQATYDIATIHTIINTAPILHVSFIPDPTSTDPIPIILPMIGQIGIYSDPDHLEHSSSPVPHCYIHAYTTSRLMRLATNASPSPGLPLCVAATKLDGLVLSLTPNSHNLNYRSAVLQGRATLVTDTAEKLWAMELLTNSIVPQRWENTRVPPDNTEMSSTAILKVSIETASAKVRVGVPEDERKDMRREDVLDKVWTGVIPVWEGLGEPVEGPYNRVKETPDHVERWIKNQNLDREEYATETARKPAPVKRKKKEVVDD